MKAGAAPTHCNTDNITVAAIMIGHHGLEGAATPSGASALVENITACYEYLFSLDPKIHVLSLALIPATGTSFDYTQGASYTATQLTNGLLKSYAAGMPDKVRGCGVGVRGVMMGWGCTK